MNALETEEFNRAQKSVLKNPAIWILAFSSAFMYISRYAVNSWGVFYLQAEKGYSSLMRVSSFPSVRFAVLSVRCFRVLSPISFSVVAVIFRH